MGLTAIALLLASAHPGDTVATRAELVNIVNSYRKEHGLEALAFNETLGKAASSHANFMALNNVLTHSETSGLPGFTGADLAERAKAVGWNDDCSELVGYASSTIQDSIQAIFDSPCHRVRFLRPGALQLGVAAQETFVCIMVGGPAGPGRVVSPPENAVGVPVSWYGSPDFAGTRTRGGHLFGYPITFVAPPSGDHELVKLDAKLVDPNGNIVPVIVRDPSNDRHYDTSMAIIPEAPLQPQMKYTASVTVVLPDGEKTTKTWSFSTAESTKR